MTLQEELQKYLEKDLNDFYDKTELTAKLRFNDFEEIHPDYVVAEFYGGLNGRGNWADYMNEIATLFDILESQYDSWLVNLENDCLDDVFYLRIGIKKK